VRQLVIGSILLSTACWGSAATLGRHSGAVVIGRPLDIRVQALAAPGEDLSTLCLKADVSYGDSPLGGASVRVTPQRSAPDAEASVRVQTLMPVNEPIVSVEVRIGCTAPFSRRYVLLADPVSEPANLAVDAPQVSTASVSSADPSAARVLPALPTSPARAGGDAGKASSAVSNGDRASATAAPVRAGRIAPSGKRPTVLARRPTETDKAAPRLQLDPVDLNLAIETNPALKLSLSLLSEPATSDQERAAAAQLWKAINATPEEILRDAQKLSVLEAEAKGLREQEVRNKAALEAMQAQVNASRTMTWLAYLFGALLLLSLLALFWFLRRGKASGDDADAKGKAAWWAEGQTAKSRAVMPTAVEPVRPKGKPVALDVNLAGESGYDELNPLADSVKGPLLVPLAAADRRDFPPSQLGVSRAVATEELFDVQQQADFFVSLGELDQAVGVLKNHLAESQEPSALAYLDLFKLYHRLGRREEYENLRVSFNDQFNAGAPPFEQYTGESRGLESYEEAFGRIQALWPQPRVLDVIEQSIFREAGSGETEVFDLEAYRELLLLHAIAKDVTQRAAEVDASRDFESTAIRPLKAAADHAPDSGAASAMPSLLTDGDLHPPASSRLGLDVDLDALSEASAFEASLPEVPVPVEPTAPSRKRSASTEQTPPGNLIDFEVMDFMPPDDAPGPETPTDQKPR
jgi:hypothetical protein